MGFYSVRYVLLLKFKPRNGRPGNGREAWLALKNKYYYNNSCQGRWTLLRWLDYSVMRSINNVDPDVFLSEVFQLRDEFDDLGETIIIDERLTTIISGGALPEEMYSTVKTQSLRDPDLGLDEIIDRVKTIFINHSERSSVSKRSKESYRKVRNNSGCEPGTNNVRESAMTFTCHNCKKPGHEKKDCKELMSNSDKPSKVENGTRKWCSYHHFNGHSN